MSVRMSACLISKILFNGFQRNCISKF